jgi:hypothetical protein
MTTSYITVYSPLQQSYQHSSTRYLIVGIQYLKNYTTGVIFPILTVYIQ